MSRQSACEESAPDALDQLVDVVERERADLAAQLHDGPVQTLTAASLRLQSAVYFGELSSDVASEVAAGIGAAATELRRLMSVLVAWELGKVSLEETLIRHVHELCGGSDVEVDIRLEAVAPLPQRHGALVLRVAQDAVADAIRHCASRLEVILDAADSGLVLEVRDDGAAVSASNGRPGLVLLRRRVEAAGGDVYVERHAEGTSVRVVLPLGPS